MKEEITCPRCDSNGLINHIRINKLNLEGYLCDECEAFWLEKDKISASSFEQFGIFMESKGLTEEPSEVTFLD